MRTAVLSKSFYALTAGIALAALCFAGCFYEQTEAEAVVFGDEIYVELSDNGSSFTYTDSTRSNDILGGMEQDGLVTIFSGGTYVLSGSLTDGAVHVDAPGEDVSLILDGVDITSGDGPAILFKDAGAASIAMNAGTENYLADGGESDSDSTYFGDYDGTLYGCVSYSVGGDGALFITGNVNEGIASEMHLTINGGIIDITAADDGMNANNDGVSEININGGSITINAGGDGIDSNGAINITGGTVMSFGAVFDNNSGLDADGDISITGGTVFASGANSPAPSNNSQKYIIHNFSSEQKGSVSVKNNEEELLNTEIPQTFTSIFYSDEKIQDDTEYFVYVNDEQAGAATTETSSAAGMRPPAGMPDNMQMPEGEPPALPERMEEGMTPPEIPEGEIAPEIPEGFEAGAVPPEPPERNGQQPSQ